MNTTTDWTQPQDVPKVNQVFPGTVTGTLLPPISEVPKEFQDNPGPWLPFINTVFFRGWDGLDPVLIRKEGVDSQKAWTQIQTVLGSYEPKHEHKTMGAAWLASLWFQDVVPADEVVIDDESSS
jgi:hypothetical protein